MKFEELGLNDSLLEALYYAGFEEATPIQEKVIPAVLNNKDVLASAQTGTGKTAAFVLPILNKLINREANSVDTLIIVPTRELAVQIEQQIQGLSYFLSVNSIALYGGSDGTDWGTQKKALMDGCDIVVATPGKLLSHLNMGYVNFRQLKHLVLDEADRMLDMGFVHDLNKIFTHLPEKYQTLMFSATYPKAIQQLSRKMLHSPEVVALATNKPAEGIDQKVYQVEDDEKERLLKEVLTQRETYESIIVFSASKLKVSDIARNLRLAGFQAKAISSNLSQEEREQVLIKFRAHNLRILVATDVMSRGIDIKDIDLVINFDIPGDQEDYVHRIGRTARAKNKGEAITFVTHKEIYKLKRIEKLIEIEIPRAELPEGYRVVAPTKYARPGNKRNSGKVKHFNKNGGKPYRKKNNQRER